MGKIYEDEPTKFKKGRLLAQGTGINSMMKKSYDYNWSDDNTILEVSNPSTLDSRWKIYERTPIKETAIMRDINNVKKRRG